MARKPKMKVEWNIVEKYVSNGQIKNVEVVSSDEMQLYLDEAVWHVLHHSSVFERLFNREKMFTRIMNRISRNLNVMIKARLKENRNR